MAEQADSEVAEVTVAEPAAAAAVATESVGLDAVVGGVGRMLTGGARGNPRIALPPPSGRGGGHATVARALLLQRAVGNANAARMLARQEARKTPHPQDGPSALTPPSGTPSQIATWAAGKVGAKHRDAIAVIDDDTRQVSVFTDGIARHTITSFESAARPIPLGNGLWRFKEDSVDGILLDDGSWYSEFWTNRAKALVMDAAGFTRLIPDNPNFLYVVFPFRGDVAQEVFVEGEPDRSKTDKDWAPHQVEGAKALIVQPKQPAEKPDPQVPVPTQLVPWNRSDKWWLNVRLGGDLRTLRLNPHETDQQLATRIKQATAQMKAEDDPNRSVRVRGTKEGSPEFGKLRGAERREAPAGVHETDLTPNAPAFPARIISHGPEGQAGNPAGELTVNGASIDFTMDLDYAAVTDGFWEEFGARWQTIQYRWEVFDVSKVKLSALKSELGQPTEQLDSEISALKATVAADPTDEKSAQRLAELTHLREMRDKGGADPDSGRARDIARDWGNTLEDTEADIGSLPMWLPPFNLVFGSMVAISDIVQLVGAPLKSLLSWLASPMSDQSLSFPTAGTYLIRCFAEPYITGDDIERHQSHGYPLLVREPSVAYLPVRVVPIHERATEANDADLAAIKNLETSIADAPQELRPELEGKLADARAAQGDNNLEAIQRAKRNLQGELDRIAAWRKGQADDIPIDQLPSDLRSWKALLDIRSVDMGLLEQADQQNLKRLDTTYKLVSTWKLGDAQGKIYRPRVTLVSEVDGRVYPIVANLIEVQGSSAGNRRWRLIDVSSEDTKDVYEGTGTLHADAINAAFTKFKEDCSYGRGTLAIRMPPGLQSLDGEEIKVTGELRAAPGFGKRWEGRLSDLAQAAEVAALFVTGPVGVGIGIAGGVIGAGLAIKNFASRVSRGKPVMSWESAMDALAVVGALTVVGGEMAKTAKMAALVNRAKWVSGSLRVAGIGMMASQVIVIPASVYLELDKISQEEKAEMDASAGDPSRVDRGRYNARRLEAWAKAVKSGLITIRMAQMSGDAEAGWDPLKSRSPATGDTPPGAKAPPGKPPPPPAGGEHGAPVPGVPGHGAGGESAGHAGPVATARQAGAVEPAAAEPLIKASGDWKGGLRRLVDGFEPAKKAAAEEQLAGTRGQALEREYAKAGSAHDCVAFDVGTVGFGSDIDATMVPKETLPDYSGPRRPISEQIRASAKAAQDVVSGLRARFGGDPDVVLDTAIHAYVGENLTPQYASPADAAAARAHDTAVSFAEARRGMTREQWKTFEGEFESRLNGETANPAERTMLERIKDQMIEGFQFKREMESVMDEYVAKTTRAAKGSLTGEQVGSLAREGILYDRRMELAKAFEATPPDWVAIKRLQSEIRWFAPGAYATEAAFVHAVRYGQVRVKAGKAAAEARGSGTPTRSEVQGELGPNLNEEAWVSPAERSARLSNAATGNLGEWGRHPHGADPKSRAKDAAKYAGRVLEYSETMGGRVRQGAMESALRTFKESKMAKGNEGLRDVAVARWADQALQGQGVTHNADGSVSISNETYTAFADAAERWMMQSAVGTRIDEGWLADQDQVPQRPAPKAAEPAPAIPPPAPPPTSSPAAAIGLSPAALNRVLTAMPAEQAVAVAGWLGPVRLERLSATPDGLLRAVDAHRRVVPLLTDPQALVGLRLLTDPAPAVLKGRSGLNDQKMIDAILSANPDNLALTLRVLARPDAQAIPSLSPQYSANLVPSLSQDLMRLLVFDRWGVQAYSELVRNNQIGDALEAKVLSISDRGMQQAAIEEILNATSTAQRRELLGVPAPARRSRSMEVKPDTKSADWQEYLADAEAFISRTDHAEAWIPGTERAYSAMDLRERAKFVEARATLMQFRDRIVDPSRYNDFQKLPQAKKLQILNQMDALAETGKVLSTWNPRARVAEALFAPGGGFSQKLFPNPAFPSLTGRGGTRFDGVYRGGEDNPPPLPGTSWVEFKSNITLSARLATTHAQEGYQDWHALLADPAKRADGMVIFYARVPEAGIRAEMSQVLLGPDSPFAAVRFGDKVPAGDPNFGVSGEWIKRPEGVPMPAPKRI